jgi:ADP-ribosylglycohydrolase
VGDEGEAGGAGGDTDTITSMAGQIAGAWVGLSDIPPALVQPLPNIEEVLALARSFTTRVVTAVREDRLTTETE